jgi:hypothetical protein
MAEIRIERKRRGLGLLWLFLALVIVAVLAWYFLYPGRNTTAPAAAPPAAGALERGAPETHGAAIAVRPITERGLRTRSLQCASLDRLEAFRGCESAARNPHSVSLI